MRTTSRMVSDEWRPSREVHAPLRLDPLAALLPAGNARYLQEWDEEDLARIGHTDRVLILGVGLAAVDAVLELDEQGHRAPLRLVSGRGPLPRAHSPLGPAIAERLAALRAAGRLEVCIGRVRGAAAYGDAFVVDVLPHGRRLHLSERYDWIVNCTGSDYARHLRTAGKEVQHLSF
jgi:uncharacterized NAD(P)/FAD-binding protein YdhS